MTRINGRLLAQSPDGEAVVLMDENTAEEILLHPGDVIPTIRALQYFVGEDSPERLHDLVAEFRKREETQDRIRERLTVERDEARAARDAHFEARNRMTVQSDHWKDRAEDAEGAIERARAVHREHTNTGLVERCKCIACGMIRALDALEATDG